MSRAIAAAVAVMVVAAACAPFFSVPLSHPGTTAKVIAPISPNEHRLEKDGGPLRRAEQLLDEALARDEAGLRRGDPIPSARLAHLRLTRSAVDRLVGGERERGVALLERAIVADGRQGFAYLYLAEIYLEKGDAGQARLLLGRAVTLLPTDRLLERELERMRERVRIRAAERSRETSG